MNPERVERWSSAKRILAVRLDAMGDVLMTTPAIRALKNSAPERHVTLWTSMAGAHAGRLVPEIDDLLISEAPWMKPRPGRESAGLEMVEMLRAPRFDAAVIFTLSTQSALPAALTCQLAGIPLRVARSRENPYDLLSDWLREDEDVPSRHDVRRQLDLAKFVGATTPDERLSLQVPQGARIKAGARLASFGIEPGSPWCVIHPGASAPSRRYPVEHFATAARELATHGWQFVVTGGPDEEQLCLDLCTAVGGKARPFGSATFDELAAVIGIAPLIISNNTGPAHIAAAVGTPVVDIYALTNPQHTPWQVPHRTLSHEVPCRNCFKSICPEQHNACIRLVSPRDVARAAMELMDQRNEALHA